MHSWWNGEIEISNLGNSISYKKKDETHNPFLPYNNIINMINVSNTSQNIFVNVSNDFHTKL